MGLGGNRCVAGPFPGSPGGWFSEIARCLLVVECLLLLQRLCKLQDVAVQVVEERVPDSGLCDIVRAFDHLDAALCQGGHGGIAIHDLKCDVDDPLLPPGIQHAAVCDRARLRALNLDELEGQAAGCVDAGESDVVLGETPLSRGQPAQLVFVPLQCFVQSGTLIRTW